MRVLRSTVAVLAMALVAGCGNGNDGPSGPSAQEAADEVAAGLSRGNLEDVDIRSGDPEKELPELLKGMSGLLPEVKVARVAPSPQSAAVRFAYSWPLSSPWTYETEATLVRDGNDWELIWKPEVLHPKLTDTNRLERQRGNVSERGNITGRNNAVLVQTTPMMMLGLDKTGLDGAQVDASAREIATAAEIDPEKYVSAAHASGATAFVDAKAVHQDDAPADFLAIEGAAVRTVTMPAPKSAGYARSLIGEIGPANEQQAAEAGPGVAPGDLMGVSGLQRAYDAQLRGSTGNRVFLATREAPLGAEAPKSDTLVADFPDVAGQPLGTTIDDRVQTAAEDSLESVRVPASVVVVRLDSGEILAAADSPEARRADDSTLGKFGPGLAASPIAALALMRSGVDLDDRVACDREVAVDGRTFENADGYRRGNGQMTLTSAFANECRTAVAAASARLDPGKLPEAAKTLGLTTNHDLGTPTNFGEFAAPENPIAKVEALTGEGGGYAQTSALALATMAASVEAGQTVVPFLVPERRPGVPEGTAPLTKEEAGALEDLMQTRSGTYPALRATATGSADNREWVVGYTRDVAVAVVISEDDRANTTPSRILRNVTAAVSRSQR